MIDIVAGARPNFVKIAPIIGAISRRGGRMRFRLVHTGQHYDENMSGRFFEQLGIPRPDANLDVGSGTQAEQTAAVMTRYERLLSVAKPTLCLVVGDVTPTMACAITARKQGVPVAHVEAGLRSGDGSMPEEINRIVTDAISNWFFTTTPEAGATLRAEGVAAERIFFVGNTMIDTLLANRDRFRPPVFRTTLGLAPRRYLVLTLHRPVNVDCRQTLATLLDTIADSARGLPVVFPVHPRTRKMIEGRVLPANLHPVPPQGYLEFSHLLRDALAVLTDSGGVSEEATVLGVPCITLREATERPETVTIGTNLLVGSDQGRLASAFRTLFRGEWKRGSVPGKWDGRAGERIVAVIETFPGCSHPDPRSRT